MIYKMRMLLYTEWLHEYDVQVQSVLMRVYCITICQEFQQVLIRSKMLPVTGCQPDHSSPCMNSCHLFVQRSTPTVEFCSNEKKPSHEMCSYVYQYLLVHFLIALISVWSVLFKFWFSISPRFDKSGAESRERRRTCSISSQYLGCLSSSGTERTRLHHCSPLPVP